MLRQLFTTDSASIKRYVHDYQRSAGPKIVARFSPGGDVIEIVDAQGRGNDLRVKTGDNQWHHPVFACYKDEAE